MPTIDAANKNSGFAQRLYRGAIKLELFQAKMMHGVLTVASTQLGKAALMMIPKYGKVAVLVVEPLRDMDAYAISVGEKILKGEERPSAKEQFTEYQRILTEHLPNIKAAYNEYKATKAERPSPTSANFRMALAHA